MERLRDLYRQAITEKSHFYVASCVLDAMVEIEKLREIVRIASTPKS
jgi:hypothetical protein